MLDCLITLSLNAASMVAASSSMILMSGMAAIGGPLLASMWMQYVGFSGFFWFISSGMLLVGIFAAYRGLRHKLSE